MPTSERRYFVDAEGIWRDQTATPSSGIRWDEIYRVTGYKLDCVTEIETCLEIDFEYGEFMEVNAKSPGFDDVIGGLTKRLPGIDPDWYRKVIGSGVEDAPVVVWQRSNS